MKALFKRVVTQILHYEATLVLKKYNPRICVVVGNVGKTTTKDAVYAVLRKKYFVRKSEKSYNSEIGVPLTILGLQNAWSNPLRWLFNIIEGAILILLKNKYPQWLVLEVGADHPGDIQNVAKWLKSDVVIFTRLPDVPVHVEFFDSPEEVCREKLSILSSLRADGQIIVNGDDEKLQQVYEEFPDRSVSYGMGEENDVRGMRYGIASHDKVPQGVRFIARHDGEDVNYEITGALGRQHMYPALAAIATGYALGMTGEEIHSGFERYEAPRGRMRILPGVKHTTIIDDTYNSSPAALEEALNVLEQVQVRGRKIAVLGDMMELGRYSIDEHKKAGRRVREVADMLLAVGTRARGIAQGALDWSMHPSKILQYDDAYRAGKELEHLLQEGDIVLVKASQSLRLERVVGEIMAEPEKKADLLVRQEIEWLRR